MNAKKVKKPLPSVQVQGVAYYDLRGVADLAGVSRQTLWSWRARGGIPAGRRHRNRLLFTSDEADLIVRRAERLDPVEGNDPVRLGGVHRKLDVVVIYSGGLDSTVLLYDMVHEGHAVRALSVDYGQRHRRELEYAEKVCRGISIEHEVADLRGINRLLGGSSLTSRDIDVPEGHYAEESMKQTIVPNRNMILLSVAAGWALSQNCQAVAYAAHGGDHAIYPDCRYEFTEAMDHALQLADWKELHLLCPFVNRSKADIVRRGTALGVPFVKTWSCYKGGRKHCGACGTCVERREAFYLAGVDDPTVYDDTAPSLKQMIAHQWSVHR